jgi:asparagine synthetase B (glutamine-hydrolysing)
VEKRLDLGLQTALMLSGGIDSASIAVLAGDIHRSRQQALPKLETISAVFPGLVCDESPSIRAVLDSVPFCSHNFQPAAWSFREETLSEMLWYSDSPIANGQIGFYEGVLARVSETGVGLLLDGFGGDELLDEEKHLNDLADRGQWIRLLVNAWKLSRSSWDSFCSILFPALSSVVSQPVKKFYRAIRPLKRPKFPVWMQPDLVDVLKNGPAALELEWGGFPSHIQTQVYKNYQYPGLIWDLTLQDTLGAHHGYLSSSPFCDRALVEFVLTIPFSLRAADGRWKYLALRALENDLPAAIRQPRPSPWYNAYASRAMEKIVSELEKALFIQDDFLSSRYIDKTEARKLFLNYDQIEAESSFWIHVHPLWATTCLEFWLRGLKRYNIFIKE